MTSGQRFITVIPDRFTSQAISVEDQLRVNKSKGIRRPNSGLQLSKETFATLRIVSSTGTNTVVVDAGSNTGQVTEDGKTGNEVYTNFILQQVTEERMEKSQVLETFGEPFIFLFGERPRTVAFYGTLVNSFDFNWESEWWYNYDKYLRGTRCVENDARVFLSYDTNLIGGYILSASSTKVADDPRSVKFQFQMFVTNYSNFSAIGDPSSRPGYGAGGEADISNSKKMLSSMNTTAEGSTDTTVSSPKLLDPAYVSDSSSVTSGLQLTSPSLGSSLSKVLGRSKSQFSLIGQAVNTYTSTSSGTGGVAIPAGQVGTFDLGQPKILVDTKQDSPGAITYSTFSKNKEEYVMSLDFFPLSKRADSIKSMEESQNMVEGSESPANEVKSNLEQNGVSVPDTQVGKLYSSVDDAPVGVCMSSVVMSQDPNSVVQPTQDGAENMSRYADSTYTPQLTNEQVTNPPEGQSGGFSQSNPDTNS